MEEEEEVEESRGGGGWQSPRRVFLCPTSLGEKNKKNQDQVVYSENNTTFSLGYITITIMVSHYQAYHEC